MQDYLKRLNKEQYTAATTLDGKVFILAGAGSGKTSTLVARVAYMLDNSVSPNEILLLTFTNKAAKEMKERIINLIGPATENVTASTFHSFCANLLRKNAVLAGLKSDYTIIDNPDMLDAISIAKETFLSKMKKSGKSYDLKDFPTKRKIGMVYEAAINNCKSFDEILIGNDYKEEIKQILNCFIEYKRSRNLLDYNDLLFKTKKLLSENSTLKKHISNQYKYISCDEYQDTNTIQNEILEYLSEVHGNLAVVGDDNQSIYAFRYANIKNILGFKDKYPDCKTIILDTNYRSSREIVNLSNHIMDYAKEGRKKVLKGTFDGVLPQLIETNDCYSEADFIISKICESEYNLKDIAIICRSSNQSYILENKLNSYGIPYNKYGGIKFMEKMGIKDLIAFLRVSVNIKDELALFRLLKLYPGIGKTYAQRISEEVATKGYKEVVKKYKKRAFFEYLEELKKAIEYIKTLSVSEQMEYLITDYYKKVMERYIFLQKTDDSKKSEEYQKLKESLQDADALLSMTKKYKSTYAFLSDLVLDANTAEDDGNKLNITTIHSAKGLEYKTVFVMDCIEGVTPRCDETSDEEPEELRCTYVAITRAKNELYIMVPHFYNIRYFDGVLSHFFNHPSVLNAVDIIKR